MVKKINFYILLALMSISILGIFGLQGFWIYEAIKTEEREFSYNVNKALSATTERIRELEYTHYYEQFSKLINATKEITRTPVSITYRGTNSSYVYKQKLMIEKTNVPISQIAPRSSDTLSITKLFSKEYTLPKLSDFDIEEIDTLRLEPLDLNTSKTLNNSTYSIKQMAHTIGGDTPIKNRVQPKLIDSILSGELKNRGITAIRGFAVIDDVRAVVIKSERYKEKNSNYKKTLFYGKDYKQLYSLELYFPNKKHFVMDGIQPFIILTLVFCFIIVGVYLLALYLLQKQRKVSEVKTDFINNMTHEFKTPITTINLIADTISTSLISSSPEKVKHYAQLIKQENKRMNTQVEMVLRISKLEKEEIDLNSEKIEGNAIVSDAIAQIKMIVEKRGGTIIEILEPNNTCIFVDTFHFTNVVQNLLDNANKYSLVPPKIEVRTFTKNNMYFIEVKDYGIGMSKSNVNKIFDKFYRVEKGNIHNVKGHGLGLSYVKKMIVLHKAEINVQSEKGKGSVFIISIPQKK